LDKVRVLVAAKSLALQLLIESLLSTRPDLHVTACTTSSGVSGPNGRRRARAGRSPIRSLESAIRREVPRIVIANVSPFGLAVWRSVVVEYTSPETKLLLVCSVEGFAREVCNATADACLAEESLVKRLLPTVGMLTRPARESSRPASVER
jgi:hypothetical protein